MRRNDASLEQPPRLHDLMPDIVNSRGSVIQTANQSIFVGDLSHARKDLANLDSRNIGPDSLVGPPDLHRRLGFHVPGVELARSSDQEELNDIEILVLRDGSPGLRERK